jgi:5-methylcytosine-specific restriction endonuclease McrA
MSSVFQEGLYKTPEWKNARLDRLKLDGFQCVECKSSSNLQVHHIHSVSKGGARFSLANLITLCTRCHEKRHKHMFRSRKR